MAAAALAWSSVEAANLEAGPLSAALALQTLRHRLVHCHADVIASVSASERALRTVAKANASKARSLSAVVERFNADHPARADVAARLQLAEVEAARARDRLERHSSVVRDALTVIRAHVNWTGRGHLLDLNTWIDLLRPERPPDPQTVRAARTALTSLLPELTPAAAAQVRLWRARFSRPSSGAQWLANTRTLYTQELDWLYATRNLTIHTGHSASTGTCNSPRQRRGSQTSLLGFWPLGMRPRRKGTQGRRGTPPHRSLPSLNSDTPSLSAICGRGTPCHDCTPSISPAARRTAGTGGCADVGRSG